MKKVKTILSGLLCVLGVWMLTACSSDDDLNSTGSEGKGVIRLNLTSDTGFKTKAVSEKDYENLDNYTVQLLKDGVVYNNFSYKYASISDFTEVENGTYTIKAFHGEDKPIYTDDLYFSGSENIAINNDTAKVEVNCKPNSARINVVFDEKMDTYFSNYTVSISTVALNGSIYPWDKNTVGPVYFKVNKDEAVKVKISLTRKNTASDLSNQIEKTYTLSPADALKLTLSPNVTSGNLEGIKITIDDTVKEHPVDIVIPSDWV